MASYDEVKLEDILHGSFATFNPNTGANKDADSLPSLIVYEEGSSTALTVTSSVTNITTGRYRWQVTIEASAGFEAGKYYEVWISATVTGTDTVSQVAPVTSFKATARVVDDVATATNVSDAQTAIITQVDANETKIDAIKAKTDNLPSDPADQSAVEAAITAATSPLATAANLATVAGYLDTEIAAILADTNELQLDWADGGRLDLILDARSSQASVDDLPTNAELATALGTADDAVLAAIATVQSDTNDIQTRLPAALESGRIAAALDSAARLAIWNTLTTGTFTADSFGELLIISDGTNGREVKVTASGHMAADIHDVQPDGLSGSTEIANIENASGYLLAVLAGACADPQTASETYAITVFGSTFTVDMAGQTSTGTRTAPTLTKT
jgi:hypothetical protein